MALKYTVSENNDVLSHIFERKLTILLEQIGKFPPSPPQDLKWYVKNLDTPPYQLVGGQL